MTVEDIEKLLTLPDVESVEVSPDGGVKVTKSRCPDRLLPGDWFSPMEWRTPYPWEPQVWC